MTWDGFILEKRKLRCAIINLSKYLKGKCKKDKTFPGAFQCCCDNGHKMKDSKVHLNKRKIKHFYRQ